MYKENIEKAKNFIRASSVTTTCILYHGDADGICGAVTLNKALQKLNSASEVTAVYTKRGENPHSDSAKRQLAKLKPDHLIVIDAGSRGGVIIEGTPTLVIDHHIPKGLPDVDIFLSSYEEDPIRPASLVAFDLCREVTDVSDLDWVAAIGTVGDLGAGAPFPTIKKAFSKYGKKSILDSVSLINASRRHQSFDVDLAFDVLKNANSPSDISNLRTDEARQLERMRQDVKIELKLKLKTAPKFAGKIALLYFSSKYQVHPLIAQTWTSRLKEYIVIAANSDFIPGKVSFSVRTRSGIDLVDFLGRHNPEGLEIGFGHRNATGGIITKPQFEELLRSLGFQEDLQPAA